MKFAKTFEKTLQEEHIPDSWLPTAIHYKLLKKQINKVVEEIHERGIDQNLTEEHVNYVYKFSVDDQREVISPRLIEIHTDEENSVDDETSLSGLKLDEHNEIILNKDRVFFQDLFSQYVGVNRLMRLEEKKLQLKISQFASIIKKIMDKNKSKDVNVWREIFNVYIDFKLGLNRKFTMKNFEDFVQHLQTTNVLSGLKKDNLAIFETFHQLNYSLLQYLTFQNLNNLALRKILKKFDKNTHFQSSASLTRLLSRTTTNEVTLISTTSIEQIISTDIVKLIPQLEDYLCPICFNIAYKPIRLPCKHIFCVRCLVKLQRQNENKCPICRDLNLMEVTDRHLDTEMMKFMEVTFPAEVKKKRKDNDREVTEETLERLGYDMKKPCSIM